MQLKIMQPKSCLLELWEDKDVTLNHGKTWEKDVGHCLDQDESRLQLRWHILLLNQPSVCFFFFYGVVYLPVPLNKQITVEVDICSRTHRLLLPPTLQIVIPFTSPVTVHLKVKVLPGQVGGAVVNCPATLPTGNRIIEFCTLYTLHGIHSHDST